MLIRLFGRLPQTASVLGGQVFGGFCAAAAVTANLGLQRLDPSLETGAVFYPAVGLAAVVSGRPAGLTVVGLIALHGAWMGLSSADHPALLDLVLWLLAGSFIAALGGELRQALDHEAPLRRQLVRAWSLGGVGDWEWDGGAGLLSLSPSAWHLLRRPAGQGPISVLWFNALLHPEDADHFREEVRKAARDPGPGLDVSFRVLCPGGEVRWLRMRGTREAGSRTDMAGVLIDIDPLERAKQECLAALKRQKLLHQELTHRTRGNFQTAASLVRLQAMRAPPAMARELEETGQRIQTMAALHEKLAVAEGDGTVQLPAFLAEICQQTARTHGAARNPCMGFEAAPTTASAEHALLLGLVTTELIGCIAQGGPRNCLEGAALRFRREGAFYSLSASCDLPEQAEKPAIPPDSIGMMLLRSCAEQLGGQILTHPAAGKWIELRFPVAALPAPREGPSQGNP